MTALENRQIGFRSARERALAVLCSNREIADKVMADAPEISVEEEAAPDEDEPDVRHDTARTAIQRLMGSTLNASQEHDAKTGKKNRHSSGEKPQFKSITTATAIAALGWLAYHSEEPEGELSLIGLHRNKLADGGSISTVRGTLETWSKPDGGGREVENVGCATIMLLCTVTKLLPEKDVADVVWCLEKVYATNAFATNWACAGIWALARTPAHRETLLRETNVLMALIEVMEFWKDKMVLKKNMQVVCLIGLYAIAAMWLLMTEPEEKHLQRGLHVFSEMEDSIWAVFPGNPRGVDPSSRPVPSLRIVEILVELIQMNITGPPQAHVKEVAIGFLWHLVEKDLGLEAHAMEQELVVPLHDIGINENLPTSLRLLSLNFLQDLAQNAPNIKIMGDHVLVEKICVNFISSGIPELEERGCQGIAHLTGCNPATKAVKVSLLDRNTARLLVAIIKRDEYLPCQRFALIALFNISNETQCNVEVCTVGLHTLMGLNWKLEDEEALWLTCGILKNCQANPANRVRLYKAELEYKHKMVEIEKVHQEKVMPKTRKTSADRSEKKSVDKAESVIDEEERQQRELEKLRLLEDTPQEKRTRAEFLIWANKEFQNKKPPKRLYDPNEKRYLPKEETERENRPQLSQLMNEPLRTLWDAPKPRSASGRFSNLFPPPSPSPEESLIDPRLHQTRESAEPNTSRASTSRQSTDRHASSSRQSHSSHMLPPRSQSTEPRLSHNRQGNDRHPDLQRPATSNSMRPTLEGPRASSPSPSGCNALDRRKMTGRPPLRRTPSSARAPGPAFSSRSSIRSSSAGHSRRPASRSSSVPCSRPASSMAAFRTTDRNERYEIDSSPSVPNMGGRLERWDPPIAEYQQHNSFDYDLSDIAQKLLITERPSHVKKRLKETSEKVAEAEGADQLRLNGGPAERPTTDHIDGIIVAEALPKCEPSRPLTMFCQSGTDTPDMNGVVQTPVQVVLEPGTARNRFTFDTTSGPFGMGTPTPRPSSASLRSKAAC
ncbi:hypothetical protein CYMTET_52469 [Cymbomonas tetramitiformis]|uniref:Uncharacterized protein n=1 Tax=Cymbomonas tetramitiformis TaxID=36881 RepID=A0AAE0EQS3_9CHLO|nr:hypothetical protein CYMTET_52469 [Cymbomonas tetramitiformis]